MCTGVIIEVPHFYHELVYQVLDDNFLRYVILAAALLYFRKRPAQSKNCNMLLLHDATNWSYQSTFNTKN